MSNTPASPPKEKQFSEIAEEQLRTEKIKGIAQLKAGRPMARREFDCFTLYHGSNPIYKIAKKTNLLQLSEPDKYLLLYIWKSTLEEGLIRTKQDKYQDAGERDKVIAAIYSSLEDIDLLLAGNELNSLLNKNNSRTEFPEQSGFTSKDKVSAQDRREEWLKELIKQQGLDALRPLGQLAVWNECANLANDPHLLPILNKRTALLISFFKQQKLIAFR